MMVSLCSIVEVLMVTTTRLQVRHIFYKKKGSIQQSISPLIGVQFGPVLIYKGACDMNGLDQAKVGNGLY